MDKIKWGIIGCGDVTEVKSGPAFNKVKDSELIAVMRRDAAKAQDYALRHLVPKWYADADLLINDPEITAVYIATPPLYHEAYAIAALQAGKHVYVEKPMTINAKGAVKIEACLKDEQEAKLSVAHYRREQLYFKKVKELLVRGAIGKVRLVNLLFLQPDLSPLTAQTETNWRLDPAVSGGGLFHDMAPHQLDLMVYFFGHALKMQGLSLKQAGSGEADDLVSGLLVFKDDILFNGLWSFKVPDAERKDSCEIIGDQGKISFSCFSQKKISLTRNGKVEEFVFEPLEHVQQPMIERVVQYFLGKGDNPCAVEDGVHVMHIMDSFSGKI